MKRPEEQNVVLDLQSLKADGKFSGIKSFEKFKRGELKSIPVEFITHFTF